MREDIKDPRKLPAKADEIWQSASDWSVNVVSAASPPGQVPEEAALNSLSQRPPPCPASCAAPCPAPHTTRPPFRTPTIAGTTATTEIKLNIAVPLAPGFQETN